MNGWIYDKNLDNSARYTLGLKGEKTLFCFGINPSTAEPNNLDNTVKSVERIAKRHGFDGWVMLNIYPQRATNPNDIHNEQDELLHSENLKHIEKIFKNKDVTILAAWGTLINKRKFLAGCLKDIYKISEKYDCNWNCIGPISKAGHPHHPLYLKNEERMKSFNILKYVDILSSNS